MNRDALKPISPIRTTLAALLPVGTEHEVINSELRFPFKKVHQTFFAIWAVEIVILLYSSPWHGANLSRHFVSQPGELFFFRQKIQTSLQPFIVRDDCVLHVGLHRQVLIYLHRVTPELGKPSSDP